MGKVSTSISGYFTKGRPRVVDDPIQSKGVLWSPTGEMLSCLFCDFVNHTKEKKLLFEDDTVIAFSPLKKAAKQHILVVPKKHISTVGDLVKEDETVLARMKEIAEELLNCDAKHTQLSFHIPPWNSIDHLHLHAFETPFVSIWQGLRYSEGKPWCASFEGVMTWVSGAATEEIIVPEAETEAETKDEEKK